MGPTGSDHPKALPQLNNLEQHIRCVLRRERINHGLKVADVSQLADISQGMLSRIENAQVFTSLEALQRLCVALELKAVTAIQKL